MARVVSSAAKDERKPSVKSAEGKRKRLPQSIRKHLRSAKAALRREHAPADAEKAIAQLVTRLRS